MEIESDVPFSSGYSPKRDYGSVELRGSKLYKVCHCNRRNGLQMDCRKSDCRGRSRGGMNHSYNQGNGAPLMDDYIMGLDAGNGAYGAGNQYQSLPDMSNYSSVPDYGLSGQAHYSVGGVGDGNYVRSGGANGLNFNTNYGGRPDASSGFMSQSQMGSYGSCMPSNETAGMAQYADYGSSGVESPAMQYQGY